MRSRLAILVAVVITAAAVVFTISRFVSFSPGPGSLPADQASYLGVYEKGPPATYQPVAEFTRVTGTQPNLVGY